jgi:tetratricopeptide (TPR) repeat protein
MKSIQDSRHLNSFDLLVLLISVFLITTLTLQSQNFYTTKVDSLKLALHETSDLSIKFNILFGGLFVELVDKDNEAALDYVTQANNVAIRLGDSLNIVRTLRGKGYVLGKLGNYKEAIEIFHVGLEIAKRNNLYEIEKILYNNVALAYTELANYDLALQYHFKSLLIRETLGNKSEVSISKNNIGLVYYKLQNFDKALEFYFQSLAIKQEIGDFYDIERTYLNIGLCFLELKQFSKAVENIKMALHSCESHCTEEINMETYAALGLVFFEMNLLDKSYAEFQQALEIAHKIKDIKFETESLIHFGLIEFKYNNYQKAINYLTNAEGLATHPSERLKIYKIFSEINIAKADYHMASNYQRKYSELKDSVYNKELLNNLANVQAQYEERANLSIIKENAKSLALQSEIIKRQKTQSILITAIAGLFLVVSVLLYSNYLKKIKFEAMLEARVRDRTAELEVGRYILERNENEQTYLLKNTIAKYRAFVSSIKGIHNTASLEVKDPMVMEYFIRISKIIKQLEENP